MLIKHGMTSQVAFLGCARNFMLASSPVYRRQQFLIRSLGAASGHQLILEKCKTHGLLKLMLRTLLEQLLLPLIPLDIKAKQIAVIGGCREYTGAPYFAAISALKIGADLSHVFCTTDAAPVIKSYGPELIVHPILEESYSVREEDKLSVYNKVLAEVGKWMERFDCLVFGPGLGRDPVLLDGLFLVTNNLDFVSGYAFAVLTPNVNEYKRLVQKILSSEVNDLDAPQQLLSLSKQIGVVTILRKGKSDLISDGAQLNQ